MTCLTDLDLRVLPWCNSLVASQWREIAISVATAPIQIKEEKTGKKTENELKKTVLETKNKLHKPI